MILWTCVCLNLHGIVQCAYLGRNAYWPESTVYLDQQYLGIGWNDR